MMVELLGADRKPFGKILQLAHVAGPSVVLQLAQHRGGHGAGLTVLVPEMEEQRSDIAAAFTQGRQHQRANMQAVVEIAPKTAGAHVLAEIAIGGGHQAKIAGHRFRAAYRLVGMVLQETQQFDLQRQGQVADLVEKKGATFGHGHATATGSHRAGKGAAHVAEQLAFQEGIGNGGTVHGHEGALRAYAVRVHHAREHLFARAGLAREQDGGVAVGDARTGADHVHHR